MENNNRTLKIVNTFAFGAMIAVNILAQVLPIGGYTTGEISAMYPTLLTPPGFTFGIWSVIYALLGWFVIRQFVFRREETSGQLGWLFAAGCAFNIAWMFFWHYQLLLFATVAIAGLWVCLLLASDAVKDETLAMRAAFRIYYGWITVAGAIQLYVFLSANLPSLHTRPAAVAVTISVMALLTIVGLAKLLDEKDGFFTMAVVWALLGVIINHIRPGYNGMYWTIILAGGACVAILLAGIIYTRIRVYRARTLPNANG